MTTPGEPRAARSRALTVVRRVFAALLLLAVISLVAGARCDRSVQALKPRWGAAPSQFVTLGGRIVHLRDEGPRDDPRPIVLLHGTSDSLHTWEGWARALRGTRRVVRFDMRGFGLTGPAPDHDYRMAAYVADARAALDALEIRHCILGGNSLGGEVAWRTALADPSRVDALVLVDAAGYPFAATSVPIGFRAARMPVLRSLMRWITPRSVVSSSVRNVFGDPARVTDALVDRFYELTLREGNRDALVERFAQSAPGEDAQRIRAIHVPTLILWGERDRLIPVSRGEQFHRDIAGSTLVVLPGLGHVPQEEDPAQSLAPVLRWIEARREQERHEDRSSE